MLITDQWILGPSIGSQPGGLACQTLVAFALHIFLVIDGTAWCRLVLRYQQVCGLVLRYPVTYHRQN